MIVVCSRVPPFAGHTRARFSGGRIYCGLWVMRHATAIYGVSSDLLSYHLSRPLAVRLSAILRRVSCVSVGLVYESVYETPR